MRETFIDTLMSLSEKDERIFLLTADLGFSVLERFAKKFPRRFINMGVAEQNTIGVAAGLALSGKIVFAYSIIPFITMRCFEQIRNNLCFQKLNVRLVGIGAGFAYGPAGATHHALEDISIMRSLTNMTVLTPGDPKETQACIQAAAYHHGPVYIRLGKGNSRIIHANLDFKIGKGIVLWSGDDLTIIASGSMLYTATKVREKLKQKGLSVGLISMPCIKPLDKKLILDVSKKTAALFTIEEHNEIGGLGSAASEVLAESRSKVPFKKFAVADSYDGACGNQDYLLDKNGLSVEKLVKKMLQLSKLKKMEAA